MDQVLRITQSKDFVKYIYLIRLFLSDLIVEYPLHEVWFEGVVKELKANNQKREILYIVRDEDEIVGVAILKNTSNEKKICTLRVANPYQKQGIGSLLVKKSCEFLGTDKPIITVSQQKHKEFIHLFRKFNFVLENIYFGKYCDMSAEYCYNGMLLPESILRNKATMNTKMALHQIA